MPNTLYQIPNVDPAMGLFGPGGGIRPAQALTSPGVVRYGGNLYAFFALDDFFTLTCWKSTDGGVNWARLNQPGEPVAPGGNSLSSSVGVFDGAHTVTFCLTQNFQQAYGLVDFDLSGETWGVLYGAAGVPQSLQAMGLFRRSTGDLVFVGWSGVGSSPSPYWNAYVFSAGVWSAPFALSTGIAALPGFIGGGPDSVTYMPAVMGSDDALHVFMYWGFWAVSTASSGRMFYVRFDSANTVSGFSEVPGQDVQANSILAMGGAAIAGTSLVVALRRYIGDGSGLIQDYVSVLVGTPLSAPAWTLLDTPGIDAAGYNVVQPGPDALPMVVSDGTTISVLSVQSPTIPTYFQNSVRVCQTAVATPLAGWSAQTVFDFLTDPAPVGFLMPGQRLTIPTLSLGSLLSLFTASLPSFSTSVYFLGFGGSAPPPSISCGSPPDGMVGASYSHAFPAVGGTPPYSFSIIAGALPTGLTLSSATGAVSGIPTFPGLYGFTVQVTDSAALTGQAVCSIQVVVSLAGLRVLLRGVKRIKKGAAPELCACPELPPAKRAV